MFSIKKFTLLVYLGVVIFIGVAATKQPPARFKNLQILPQNISDERLDSFMNVYTTALKVDCKFCHYSPEGFPDSVDFASDKNHMKNDARKMMRLTMDINKNYFNYNNDTSYLFLTTVTCNTCHRGSPWPEE